MARLPSPPAPSVIRSRLRDGDVVAVTRRQTLTRIFTSSGRHQMRWDTFRHTGPLPHARFDPQMPDQTGGPVSALDHGVLYFSLSLVNSVASVFQATSLVDRTTRRPFLVSFRPRRGLQLLDLTRNLPTRLGASQEISTGPKGVTQEWARAIRAAAPELDGLQYRSAMDAGNPTIVLWDPPGSSALPDSPDLLLPLDYPALDIPLTEACHELNYILL